MRPWFFVVSPSGAPRHKPLSRPQSFILRAVVRAVLAVNRKLSGQGIDPQPIRVLHCKRVFQSGYNPPECAQYA